MAEQGAKLAQHIDRMVASVERLQDALAPLWKRHARPKDAQDAGIPVPLDREGRIRTPVRKLGALLGNSESLEGFLFASLVYPSLSPPDWRSHLETKGRVEVTLAGPEGNLVPVSLRRSAAPHAERENGCWTVVVDDRSAQGRLRHELAAVRENYATLADTVTEAIIQIDHSFIVSFSNNSAKTIFGYEAEELLGQDLGILFPETRVSNYRSQIEKYFFIDAGDRRGSGLGNSIEMLGRRKNGDVFPLEISLGNSKGVGDSRILTCILRDITLRKNDERKLRFLAYHDQLTALGNRDRLSQSLAQLIAEIQRQPDRQAALLFLDLDGFKKVNDSLGHEMGDAILKETAKRLTNCLRQDDQIYRFQVRDIFRLGGDEFTVLLPFIRKPEDAAIVARRIIDKILQPYEMAGYGPVTNISMGVSVGIALVPEDGMDQNSILRNADAAMYKAKETGNHYAFFHKEMNNKALERLVFEEGLRRSLENNDFELHYQPVFTDTGKVVGLEALLRWQDPDGNPVPPDRFVPVAEDSGLIAAIGKLVLETACFHLRHLHNSGHSDLFVAVNLSAKQLEQRDLPKMVLQILKKTGLEAHHLVLELTETAIMKAPEQAIQVLRALSKASPGLGLAVDDFGTGYSSLSYLSQFPVDILKIDRDFVINMSKASNKKIVNSIVSLGHSLEMKIIAEGVETEEQLTHLVDRECDLYQGYYFAKPLPFSEVAALMVSRQM
ncbi:MAG: putative bifunctional diguanylate cyclase/phosphodiesterase [Spirochaetota bacterium]